MQVQQQRRHGIDALADVEAVEGRSDGGLELQQFGVDGVVVRRRFDDPDTVERLPRSHVAAAVG